jgi:hypothetical protein
MINMEKSFGLLFYPKKNKGYKDGASIYIIITVNGIVAELSTRRKCDPSKWECNCGKGGRAEGRTEFAKSLNDYLGLIQRKVYEVRIQLMERDEPVTA